MWKFITIFIAVFLVWQVSSELFSDTPPSPSPNGAVPFSDRRKVILFTGSEWCPACKHLDQAILMKDAWKKFQQNEIRMDVIDVNSRGATSRQESMLREYDVEGFPTMVLTNASGKEIGRKVGVTGDMNHYIQWIRTER